MMPTASARLHQGGKGIWGLRHPDPPAGYYLSQLEFITIYDLKLCKNLLAVPTD